MNKLTDTDLPAINVLDLKRNFIEYIRHPIFCSVFNYKHYVLIKAMIIFDDCTTRDQKWKTDRFAEFRNIFEAFNKQCAKNIPSDNYVAPDETLYPPRGVVGFKTYNKDKPAKYGFNFRSFGILRLMSKCL